MHPPLEGLTVLDFSHALAGPYCTMLLAAYGARVIKIESPGQGDVGRSWGPPFQGGEASYFLGLHSSKQSLAVDLKQPEGLDICRRLAAHADILIENFRPGTMNRLGLGYASVAPLNRRLIYVSISGYGQTGPRSNEASMDLVTQASAGLMRITGTLAGETVRSGHSVADVTAGMFALIGAMLALEARHRTGEGQFVDVSMLDTLMSTMAPSFAYYLGSGIIPAPMGTRFATIVPYRNFTCSDREVTIAVASDKLWESFCHAISRPDLLDDQRYRSNRLRVEHRGELEPLLEEMFRGQTAAHWVEVLGRAGIPCSPVRNLREVVEDEHVQARDMLPEVEHPTAGRIRVTGAPVKLSQSHAGVPTAARRLGEDSTAVLSEFLRMDQQEIERLRQAGVIA
jgi:crotonobetainyl-CoA:carnitine CoA-transferase CaiB-like acyl-CoA transferase